MMLVPILRAVHCRSTHHFFAIDALERLGTESGRRLGELLLKHYARYLKGSKDPDDTFKDFQNHVLHVRQNHWGGAPRLCQQWLDTALQHMRAEQWSEAAYACGVLSHYFTDPIMPLHTGQTKRESVVHRPMEWSICKAYEEIYAQCQFKRATYQLRLQDGPTWIGPAVIECATIAHQHYERLIEIYNLPRGVADPPRGLTKEARQILADLFDLAMGGWAVVLTRMAAELPRLPPDTSLTLATVIAGVDLPRAWVVHKFSDAAQRAEVQRIFDEYTETGSVIDNLPAEIKVVQRELKESLRSGPAPTYSPPTPEPTPTPAPKPISEPTKSPAAAAQQPSPQPSPQVPPPVPTQVPTQAALAKATPAIVPVNAPAEPALQPGGPPPSEEKELVYTSTNFPVTDEVDEVDDDGIENKDKAFYSDPQDAVNRYDSAVEDEDRAGKQSSSDSQPSRAAVRVTYDSPVVDAPSIGPKTARRLNEVGIQSIGDLVDADPIEISDALGTTWITAELIGDWQDQAMLVCEVPALCGYKAQLLVAVDCRTAEQLALADARQLHSMVSRFAKSKEGQRILRSSATPTATEVESWIQAAVLERQE